MLTARNATSGRAADVLVSDAGELLTSNAPMFLELGEVIGCASGQAGYQVAAGAYCYSSYYGGVEWVRNLLLLAKSEGQIYDLYVTRKDTAGQESMSIILASAQGGTYSWRSHNIIGASALCGPYMKLGMRNAGTAAVNMSLRAELLG